MTENEEKVAEDQEKEVDMLPEAQQEDSGGQDQGTEEEASPEKDNPPMTPRKSPRKKMRIDRYGMGEGEQEEDTGDSSGAEVTRIPPRRSPVGLPPAFHQVRHFILKLTPKEPRLIMEPRRILQVKRAPGTAHPGGISTTVEVSGFGKRYARRLRTLIRERTKKLGACPASQSEKSIKRRIKEFYTHAFRGETGLLQLVYFELKHTKHCHTKRPPNSYCFRCRLIEEARNMSRVRLLDTDQLLTEEVWENNSEKEGDVEEDSEDNYWFGEEAGHEEVTDQGTSEVQVLGKSKKRTKKTGVDVGPKKRRGSVEAGPYHEGSRGYA